MSSLMVQWHLWGFGGGFSDSGDPVDVVVWSFWWWSSGPRWPLSMAARPESCSKTDLNLSRWLVQWWQWLSRRSSRSWSLVVIALLWQRSFGQFSHYYGLPRWKIPVWVCFQCWGEPGGTVDVVRDNLGWPDGGPTIGHFFASLLRREFFGLFSNDRGLFRWGGKARVDRGVFKLKFWHSDLVCNRASWSAAM